MTATPADRAEGQVGAAVAFAPITILLFLLGIIVPGIALVVRRFHDANFSGLLALLWLIPYLGGLVVLILCIMPTQPMGRRFDRANAGWVPGGPQAYGQFGASPYSQPAPYGQPASYAQPGAPGAPTAGGPQAADLSHALAPLLGADRGAVAEVARRFHAEPVPESSDGERLRMPDADVLTRYDGAGRLTGVQVAPRA